MASQAKTNLTEGPIWRAMVQIAVPVAVGMIFNTLYAITDTFFAGQISTQAMAGLGVTFPVYIFMLAIGIGIGQGTTALVSTDLGAGRTDNVRVTIGQALTLAAVLGSLVSTFVFLAGQPILNALIGDEALVAAGMPYIKVVSIAAPFMALGMVANGALTAEGNAKPYRNIVIIGFFVNLILDPLFALDEFMGVPGLGLGLGGIAFATLAVQVMSAVIMYFYVRRTNVGSQLTFADLKLSWPISSQILVQGFAASMNMVLVAVGALIQQRLVAPYGSEAVAGQTVGLRINQLFLLPLIGVSSAMLAMTGQARGAGLGKRVLAIYAQLNFWGVVGMVIVAAFIAFTAPWWSGLFSSEPEVQRLTTLYLYVTVPMMPVWCFVFLSQSFAQGLQKPYPATLANILRQIPFPFFFVWMTLPLIGESALSVWIGIAIGNTIGAIMMTAYVLWCAPKVVGESWLSTDLRASHEKQEDSSTV